MLPGIDHIQELDIVSIFKQDFPLCNDACNFLNNMDETNAGYYRLAREMTYKNIMIRVKGNKGIKFILPDALIADGK